jgi:hypothetical protein
MVIGTESNALESASRHQRVISYALWRLHSFPAHGMKEEHSGGLVKRFILVLGVSVAVLGSGVAAATVLSSSPSPAPSTDKKQAAQTAEKESDETSIHGGPITRFHTLRACKLIDVTTLTGNWTHGDYVSAVEALGDSSMLPIAAHSDCGKALVAVGHRHGPPDFVTQKVKVHQRGAEGPEETPGS